MKKTLFILIPFLFLSFVVSSNTIDYKILRTISSKNVQGKMIYDIEPIITNVLNETKRDLTFELKSNSDVVEQTKVGNCVGYTKYFNSHFISKLKQKGFGNITVSHVRAKVLMMGQSIHVFKDKSLKDHDISVIYNKTTQKTYFVDASLSEVLGNIILIK